MAEIRFQYNKLLTLIPNPDKPELKIENLWMSLHSVTFIPQRINDHFFCTKSKETTFKDLIIKPLGTTAALPV